LPVAGSIAGNWQLKFEGVLMAKDNREMAWMQCTECSDLNYRTEIKVVGGAPKLERKRYCPRERKHTPHKLKRK
jgi:large subunit ribosomal protein L33